MTEEINRSEYAEELEVIQDSLAEAVDTLFEKLGLMSSDSIVDPILVVILAEDLKDKIYTDFDKLFDYSVLDDDDSEDIRVLVKPKTYLAKLLMVLSQLTG